MRRGANRLTCARNARPADLTALALDEMRGSLLKAESNEVLQMTESPLYPALQRLLLNGWVETAWGGSEHPRRARCHTPTAAGGERLAEERQEGDRLVPAGSAGVGDLER